MMTNRIKHFALAGSVALLAACGGNKDNGGGEEPAKGPFEEPIVGTLGYIDIVTDANAMADTVINLNTGELDDPDAQRTDLPDDGSATYTGYIGGTLNGEGLIGTLALTAEFAVGDSGGISSVTATNFEHQTKGEVAGTLTSPADGVILPNAGDGNIDLFNVDLTGNLTLDGDNLATELALEGSFFEGAPNAPTTVAGGFVGSVGDDDFDGAFVATAP